MAEQRKGSQIPNRYVVLPYQKTLGREAVEIYNKTGRTAQEWQEIQMHDIMAVNDDGLWTHAKYGYSVPRRNGKSELVLMREMWGLTHGERILHTAHRTTTSHSAWEKLCGLLAKSGLREKEDYRTIKQFGLERIEMLDGSGAVICFRTRSSKGGLGEGYDLLVIDEAQEYTDDQETALKYVVTDSKNPQTIYCGTPPTVVSAGTVFLKYRKDVLSGQKEDAGWTEWSVGKQTDPKDVEAWYSTNPSLGTIFTERNIRSEIGSDEIDFNIQRLGLWISYNQKSEISETEWMSLRIDKIPDLKGEVFAGIKYGHDGENVSVSVAVKTKDGKVFVEGIDCRPMRAGNDWIISFLKSAKIKHIAIDGASGQSVLAEDLKDAGMKKPTLPTVKEVISANAVFVQALESAGICHAAQPSMVQAVTNCEKRAIGSGGGFGYRSSKEGVEIALMDSMILAYWLCSSAREKKKQKISY